MATLTISSVFVVYLLCSVMGQPHRPPHGPPGGPHAPPHGPHAPPHGPHPPHGQEGAAGGTNGVPMTEAEFMGMPADPLGRKLALSKPDQDRYDEYLKNFHAGQAQSAAEPAAAPAHEEIPHNVVPADSGEAFSGAAQIDENLIEKDKEEILEELEKRAEEMVGEPVVYSKGLRNFVPAVIFCGLGTVFVKALQYLLLH